jgi:hypothetical protein
MYRLGLAALFIGPLLSRELKYRLGFAAGRTFVTFILIGMSRVGFAAGLAFVDSFLSSMPTWGFLYILGLAAGLIFASPSWVTTVDRVAFVGVAPSVCLTLKPSFGRSAFALIFDSMAIGGFAFVALILIGKPIGGFSAGLVFMPPIMVRIHYPKASARSWASSS